MNNITENEILKYITNKGIIDLDDVQKTMKQEERNRLLKKHKFQIFQSKDGKWRTYVYDESKKEKRRLIKRTTKESIEKFLIDFYATEEDKELIHDLKSIREIYPEWLAYKNSLNGATSYTKRIDSDWKKYYLDSKIIDIPIEKLDYITLNEWTHKMIKEYNFTKKQYYNMSVIIRQCLIYCVEKEYLEVNPFERVRIDSKLFRKTKKPESKTQVFYDDERNAICEYAMYKFNKNNRVTTPLAIILNFELGLRIGELSTIKWSDISNNYIHIQRMESGQFALNVDKNDYKLYKSKDTVVDHTKSPSGDRYIYLTEKAKSILSLIKKTNFLYGYNDEDYIFVSRQHGRLHSGGISIYLKNICDEINLTRKSNHKIRKTFVSKLINTGMGIERVRVIAGHEDERTTLGNYCFDTRRDKENENLQELMYN